jgi:hypothetical protein
MSIIACGLKGIRDASARPKMVVVLWLANLLAAVPLYLVFSAAWGGAVGASGLGGSLASKTDMNAVVEVLTGSSSSLRNAMIVALGLAALYELAAIFLAGGILETLIRKPGKGAFASAFFGGGGRFYGRFFRLSVVSLLLWVPAAGLYLVLDLALSAAFHDPNLELLGFYLDIFRGAFALALFFLIKMIVDYARIRIAVRDSRGAAAGLLSAVRFVGRRPGRTLGLYCGLGLLGLGLLALYGLADSSLPKTSPAAVAAGLALAQIFILSRGWLKIVYQAGQMEFYLAETGMAGRSAGEDAPTALSRSSQGAGRKAQESADQIESGVDRDAQQPERQEKKPDHGVEDQGQERQGPAEDEQDQPQEKPHFRSPLPDYTRRAPKRFMRVALP